MLKDLRVSVCYVNYYKAETTCLICCFHLNQFKWHPLLCGRGVPTVRLMYELSCKSHLNVMPFQTYAVGEAIGDGFHWAYSLPPNIYV